MRQEYTIRCHDTQAAFVWMTANLNQPLLSDPYDRRLERVYVEDNGTVTVTFTAYPSAD